MSVIDPPVGVPFIIRIYKGWGSAQARSWANSYELIQSGGAPSENGLRDAAAALIDYERDFHLSDIYFDRCTVSTWTPDSRPYDPEAFVTIPIGANGRSVAGLGGDAESPCDLRVCLKVAYGARSGRQGFRLYRGCLRERDVFTVGGDYAISPGNVISQTFSQAKMGNLNPLLLSDSGLPYKLGLRAVGHTRLVTAVGVAGVTIKKMNNRYFDKENSARA
jgi:hypothetical protein